LKIVFMGTPEFARVHLDALASARDDELLVVTRPDLPAGRGRRLTPPPVKLAAEALGLPVLQPRSTLDADFIAKLTEFAPDLLVVVAYRLLPDRILQTPRICAINVHPSLLPKYRGAAPIPRALMHGETRTGVSIIRISSKMDSGDIVARRATNIGPDETAGELAERLAGLGTELLLDVLGKFDAGAVMMEKQDHTRVTLAPAVTKEEALVDWSAAASTVGNLVRALNPKPVACSFLHRTGMPPVRLGILRGRPLDVEHAAEPGGILDAHGRILVACGHGGYELAEVAPAGRRKMPVEAFLAGNAVKGDAYFSSLRGS